MRYHFRLVMLISSTSQSVLRSCFSARINARRLRKQFSLCRLVTIHLFSLVIYAIRLLPHVSHPICLHNSGRENNFQPEKFPAIRNMSVVRNSVGKYCRVSERLFCPENCNSSHEILRENTNSNLAHWTIYLDVVL